MSQYIVGLTGGIGSGKTTIANMFIDLGINIVDADIIARQVVAPDSPALTAISQHFGKAFIQADGQLNRALLRSQIFSHPADKTWLNNLLHPLIRKDMITQLQAATSPYCLLVAPLLIENQLDSLVNRVLVVDVSEALQVSRTQQRDTSSADEIKAIIASQASRTSRLAAADDVIDNSQEQLSKVQLQVADLDRFYRQQCK